MDCNWISFAPATRNKGQVLASRDQRTSPNTHIPLCDIASITGMFLAQIGQQNMPKYLDTQRTNLLGWIDIGCTGSILTCYKVSKGTDIFYGISCCACR